MTLDWLSIWGVFIGMMGFIPILTVWLWRTRAVKG